MARRQSVPLCSRCETPFRSEAAFCSECHAPTPWATHDDRVEWEVRQWRASRAREPQESKRMMLVRTEAGYQPAPVDDRLQYTWDQPLHQERETQAQNGHAENGRAQNGHAAQDVISEPEPEAAPDPDPVPEAPRPVEPTPVVPRVDEGRVPRAPRDDVVSISKKAVAVGVALALGLPLGSKVLNLSGSKPEAARRPAVAQAPVAPARPATPVAVRSGFVHLSPDAARYAVVIRNPNRSYAARSVTVSVGLRDRTGRLVGTDLERIATVPAAGTVAIAGATGVAGRVADLSVRISVGAFEPRAAARPFVVRSVRLSRSGPDLLVRAGLSGARSVAGARVVAVHIDARGAIIGGDFAYVDVPRSPRSTTALISTSGLGSRVRRVEVYVLAPR